jgi:farnesyl diphosphate synthase
MHTFALIADDIMDGSLVRRGKPAWHTRCDVGLSAVNDAILLENINWTLLKKYFHSTKYYEKLLFLIQDTALVTILGQSLDTRFSIDGDYSRFTRTTYDTIVKYKTSLYSFYTPVAIAMILVSNALRLRRSLI